MCLKNLKKRYRKSIFLNSIESHFNSFIANLTKNLAYFWHSIVIDARTKKRPH